MKALRSSYSNLSHSQEIGQMVERGGFEPPKAAPADLQSAPFDRSGTSPFPANMEPAKGIEPPTH